MIVTKTLFNSAFPFFMREYTKAKENALKLIGATVDNVHRFKIIEPLIPYTISEKPNFNWNIHILKDNVPTLIIEIQTSFECGYLLKIVTRNTTESDIDENGQLTLTPL